MKRRSFLKGLLGAAAAAPVAAVANKTKKAIGETLYDRDIEVGAYVPNAGQVPSGGRSYLTNCATTAFLINSMDWRSLSISAKGVR